MTTATEAPPDLAANKPAPAVSPKRNTAEYNANVPVDLISPDPKNRDKINPERVKALADNIDELGLLQPIVLQLLPDGKYRLMAGEHRWRAVKQLKLPTIAARIYRDQSALDAAMRKAAENAMRVDLTPIEKAKRYQELAELGATQKEIGVICGGISQPVVANALRLLTLPKEVQELLAQEKLSEAHGVSLARFAKWPRLCLQIAKYIVGNEDGDSYSVKDLNREKLPFNWQLKNKGFVVEIRTRVESWENDDAYKIPDSLPQDDFIKDGNRIYYVIPENPKDNIWAPEQAKQDAARATAAAEKAKKNAGSLKAGKPTKDQLERKKKLDENKRNRTTVTVTLAGAVSRLIEAKAAPSSAVQVVFENSVKSSYLEAAAHMLGIKLPVPDDELEELGWDDESYRALSYRELWSIGDDKLLRLAACTVMLSEASDAQRFASPVPECIGHIAAGKLVVQAPEFEELKGEKPEFIAHVEDRLKFNATPGQIAKEFEGGAKLLPAIKAIKKGLVAKREQQAVIDEASKPKASKKGKKKK